VAVPDVTIGIQRDPALARAIADISAAEIRATDSALVSFGTRHTMSDTLSATRGIGAAAAISSTSSLGTATPVAAVSASSMTPR
jgi:hypothetical protein